MKSVLWIEDQAYHELGALRTPVIMSSLYHLTIAVDGASAIENLRTNKFEIIIVDMRIPPGDDPIFTDIYYKNSDSKRHKEIGLLLLKRIFEKEDLNFLSDLLPYAYDSSRYGVLSIDNENEISDELKALGIKNYAHKSGAMSSKSLLNLILSIDKSLLK